MSDSETQPVTITQDTNMNRIVPVQLTAAEVELLQWLMRQGNHASRGAAIRSALLVSAMRKGAPEPLVDRVQTERDSKRPRSHLLPYSPPKVYVDHRSQPCPSSEEGQSQGEQA